MPGRHTRQLPWRHIGISVHLAPLHIIFYTSAWNRQNRFYASTGVDKWQLDRLNVQMQNMEKKAAM